MRVLVAGWVGSTNLGDELVLAGLRGILDRLGVAVHVLSRDPAHSRDHHGVPATRDTDLSGSWRVLRSADAVAFGGGGLVHDVTSPFNLPYHLSRVWAAEATRTPWAGVGLGVGPLGTRLGRRLARSLRRAVAVSVRDPDSAALLERIGVPGAVTAADLALHLPRPRVEVEDVVTVSLRPWSGGGGGLLPVAQRPPEQQTPAWFLAHAARALDAVADASGLTIRFVALQTDRDHAVHLQVADRMRHDPQLVVPTLDSVVGEIGRGRAVVAMRYHAAIAATLAGRPVVGIGYTPKVDALAADLGAGARLLRWEPDDLGRLPDAIAAVLGRDADVDAGHAALVARGAGNLAVVERLLDAAGRPAP
jgi:polysaccharide pyruvyl transferase CsaB